MRKSGGSSLPKIPLFLHSTSYNQFSIDSVSVPSRVCFVASLNCKPLRLAIISPEAVTMVTIVVKLSGVSTSRLVTDA